MRCTMVQLRLTFLCMEQKNQTIRTKIGQKLNIHKAKRFSNYNTFLQGVGLNKCTSQMIDGRKNGDQLCSRIQYAYLR